LFPSSGTGFGPGEARAGQVRRLATFQDGGNDVRGETAEPYQLREVVRREPMFVGDRSHRLIAAAFSYRPASSVGIGRSPDQPFIGTLLLGP
jgi:hypothetical protein